MQAKWTIFNLAYYENSSAGYLKRRAHLANSVGEFHHCKLNRCVSFNTISMLLQNLFALSHKNPRSSSLELCPLLVREGNYAGGVAHLTMRESFPLRMW